MSVPGSLEILGLHEALQASVRCRTGSLEKYCSDDL